MSVSPLNDSDRAASADRTFLDDRPHRLRLHHLFVLTAVMAVLLAINGPHKDYASANYEPPPLFRVLWFMVGIAHTILSAAALTALGYGIAWYGRGLRFFDQPGHWLLAEISLTALLDIVPSFGYRWIGSPKRMMMGDSRMEIIIILMGYTLLFLVVGRMAVNIYLGKTKCNERWWKFVFYAKALATVLLGLGGLVVLPVTLYALRADHRRQVTRDAGHRCGVALQLALSSLTLFSVATMVYNMLAFVHR
jgi:hypothetical protein